tara:strand:- start:4776 stop:5567 length:792 start_codon:yes stop_codon:yes gene_type:complete
MSSVKDSILLKGTSSAGAVATDLKLHWDTTQTSLSGSTGVLTALAGSATGDFLDPSDVNKSDASSVDALGNQGWKFQNGTGNTQLSANQSFSTILGSTATNYTLEVWCKIDSKHSNGGVFAHAYGRAGSSTYGTAENFILGLYGVSSTASQGGMHSLHYSANGNTYANLSTSNLNYGFFAQYVVTINATTIIFYQNGAAAGSISSGGGTPRTQAADFIIGGRYGYSNEAWNGVFRICRLYSKALSASEVLTNYNADKAKFGLT